MSASIIAASPTIHLSYVGLMYFENIKILYCIQGRGLKWSNEKHPIRLWASNKIRSQHVRDVRRLQWGRKEWFKVVGVDTRALCLPGDEQGLGLLSADGRFDIDEGFTWYTALLSHKSVAIHATTVNNSWHIHFEHIWVLLCTWWAFQAPAFMSKPQASMRKAMQQGLYRSRLAMLLRAL